MLRDRRLAHLEWRRELVDANASPAASRPDRPSAWDPGREWPASILPLVYENRAQGYSLDTTFAAACADPTRARTILASSRRGGGVGNELAAAIRDEPAGDLEHLKVWSTPDLIFPETVRPSGAPAGLVYPNRSPKRTE